MHNIYKTLLMFFAVAISSVVFAAAINEQPVKDPTQPPSYRGEVKRSKANRNIKITAIFSGDNKRSVMIGGKIFKVGDKILDFTIVAINSDSIRVKNGKGEFEIVMPHSNFKTKNRLEGDREKV